jgi:hypothetical protein
VAKKVEALRVAAPLLSEDKEANTDKIDQAGAYYSDFLLTRSSFG